ncbi:hypothetical protein BU24DRAFT_417808, partial [Aaosphaeria arxii CBS 175.79]
MAISRRVPSNPCIEYSTFHMLQLHNPDISPPNEQTARSAYEYKRPPEFIPRDL